MNLTAYQKRSPILLAGLGLLCIAAYFGVTAKSNLTRVLKFEKDKAEILALAQQAFEASPLSGHTMHRNHEIAIDNMLLQFAQQHDLPDSLRARMPLARWKIFWGGEIAERESKNKSARYVLEYDQSGRFVGFSQNYPGLKDSLVMTEAEALHAAHEFLLAQSIDTASVKLSQKKITAEDSLSKHEFTFTRPVSFAEGLTENFSVEVAGNKVTDFSRTLKSNDDKEEQLDAETIVKIVVIACTVLMWAIVCIFLLVIFFRRLRHDELEFRRALWWGAAGLLVFGAATVVRAWPEWAGMAFGGIFTGLFAAGGLFIVYAAAESMSRDVCPEKLILSDLVQRGRFRVREVGAALLRALFIAGLSLLTWSLIIWATGAAGLGHFEIESDTLWFLRPFRYWIGNALSTATGAAFIATIFLCFWSAYLRGKIKRPLVFFLTLMLSLHLAGFYMQYIKPYWLGAILCLPLSALWTYFVTREDFFTNFVAVLIFFLLVNCAVIALSPETLWAGPLPWLALFLVATTAVGLFFYKSENLAEDFEHYVPAYVSRIATRERLLKELEIARSVQMRFLPERVPLFPSLELASICRPAMEVGGDYFDLVPHGNNEALSVFVGDVSGKGVSAAFFMTMAKGIIKTLVKRLASPKELLTQMNEVFYENTPKEVFISLIYGYFDMRRRTLTFARAGHNPLIVRKSRGNEPEMLHPNGLAIGMDAGYHFAKTIEEITVPIMTGDVFVFYTDGISESMNAQNEEFGEDRLCEVVNQNAQDDAQTLLQKITEQVNAFTNGARQHDDFTMVVVKVAE